jgi:2-keto-4-pentenoate hydratase/2-oxohepta-3-ene-1,7-dioic acid hydratase in catechol pathway
MKNPAAVIGPGEPIVLPECCKDKPQVDFEAELAVVIGRAARNVTAKEALSYVKGYTAANDVSARSWQKHAGGGQWVRGKSFDTFCPLGPALITPDEILNPDDLGVSCVLNGETMQESRTSDMIFPVSELIAFLSEDTTLLPNTVILTGTPSGVGFTRRPPVYLKAGDRLETTVEKIGTLGNPVV